MGCFSKLFGTSSNIDMSDATALVREHINSNAVVVFSKSYCPYCAATKSLLKDLGVQANIIELDRTDGGSAMQDALEQLNGQRTVPNIYIGQEHIGGNSELQALEKSDKLKPLLKKAGEL